MYTGSDETGNVGHVGDDDGPHPVADAGKLLEIDNSWIGGGAAEQKSRFVLLGHRFYGIEVEETCLHIDSVLDRSVVKTGNTDGGAVREVSAVGQRHPHDRVPRLDEGRVDCLICRRS